MTERINGVPTDGATAYKEGILAGDCPYFEQDPDFNRWNDEWDAAADEASMAKPPPKVGSVITGRYRAKYAEAGHPTHCGDRLALLLNSVCVNKAGTNLELFEAICAVNGVDLSKYDRQAKGWQGRLRMTGRNLLAKKVLAAGGKLLMPEHIGQTFMMDADWIETTTNKYKPRKD